MYLAILYDFVLDYAFRAFGSYHPDEEIQDIAFRLGQVYANEPIRVIDILILF